MLIIRQWLEKIKPHSNKLYLILIFILLISLVWGLTKLYFLEQGRTPVTIENV